MKRFILVALVSGLSLAALAPAALGAQASVTREISEDASITDLVRHNRMVRNKK